MIFEGFFLLQDLHLLVELDFLNLTLESLLFALMIFIKIVSDTTLFLYSVLADIRVELVGLWLERRQWDGLGSLPVLNIGLKSFKNCVAFIWQLAGDQDGLE